MARQDPPPSMVPESGRLSETLQRANALRAGNGDGYVAVDHLVLAAAEADPAVQQELQRVGVSPKRLPEAFKRLRGTRKVTSEAGEAGLDALGRYARDLVADAARGQCALAHLPRLQFLLSRVRGPLCREA